MKKVLIILAIMTQLSSRAEAFEFGKDVKSILTKGTCFTEVSNDKININIRVSNTDKTSADKAMYNTNKSYSALETYIKGLNISGLELETGNVSISEDKQWDKVTRGYVINGYKAEITTNVEMPMSAKDSMGTIISKSSTYQGAYLDGFSMSVSSEKLETTKADCLAKAIKNAKMKAEKMATAAGTTLKGLLSASDEIINSPRPYRMNSKALMSMSDNMEAAPVNINSKDQEVRVEVQTSWEIK